MTGDDRRAELAEVQGGEEGVSGGEFDDALGADGDETDQRCGARAAVRVWKTQHLHCGDGHQAVGDAGEPAEAVAGDERRGAQCHDQAAGGGCGDIGQTSPALPGGDIGVENQERRSIEEEVILGNVDEGVGEQAPPFASGDGISLEGKRRGGSAGEKGQIEQEEKRCERQQFRAKTVSGGARDGTSRRGGCAD